MEPFIPKLIECFMIINLFIFLMPHRGTSKMQFWPLYFVPGGDNT